MSFSRLFEGIDCKVDAYRAVFLRIKSLLIEKLKKSLASRTLCPSGRKRNLAYLEKFFDVLYYLLESGSQMKRIKELHGLSIGTFYWYLNWMIEKSILKCVYEELICSLPPTNLLIVDSFTVKSMMGSVGLGRNPTDRGRKGLKGSLICDTNRVVRGLKLGPANQHDVRLLEATIDTLPDPHPQELVSILCDSGYVGKKIRDRCRKRNFRLIVKPRKTRRTCKTGFKSHLLLKPDAELLRKKRNLIELLNGNIRRFRSLMIKWVRRIETYECLLYLGLLCISCYQTFVPHRHKKTNKIIRIKLN